MVMRIIWIFVEQASASVEFLISGNALPNRANQDGSDLFQTPPATAKGNVSLLNNKGRT